MIKYYKTKDVEGNDIVCKLVEDESNTMEQLLRFNPKLTEETTVTAYRAQELPKIKAARYVEINERTDELITKGFEHEGIQFNITLEDQANMDALLGARSAGLITTLANQYFRASEDYFFVSDEDFDEIYMKGLAHKDFIIRSGAVLKKQIANSTSKTDIGTIKDDR